MHWPADSCCWFSRNDEGFTLYQSECGQAICVAEPVDWMFCPFCGGAIDLYPESATISN